MSENRVEGPPFSGPLRRRKKEVKEIENPNEFFKEVQIEHLDLVNLVSESREISIDTKIKISKVFTKIKRLLLEKSELGEQEIRILEEMQKYWGDGEWKKKEAV